VAFATQSVNVAGDIAVMQTVKTIQKLREKIHREKSQGKRIAFVPTMGNLHEGHIALVLKAKTLADFVVTSIFVNPMQFGQNEDLDNYPRTLAEDSEKLIAAGNNLLFTPTPEVIYPHGLEQQTQVIVPFVTELHCGASRPGHFTGVSTVVNMLFNMVQPHVAIFGEKDFQQLAVIKKMVKDLQSPVEIHGHPTKRAADGLALSSRNGYLTDAQRKIAPSLYQTLQNAAKQLEQRTQAPEAIATEARMSLEKCGFNVDYVNIVDSDSLQPATANTAHISILAAAFLGSTRLIDNISVPQHK
jgi:pantoate--beta-alanine ligase